MDKKLAKKIARHYIKELEDRAENSIIPASRFQAQAELEDIEDGHWDGPRTDDPPPGWQG